VAIVTPKKIAISVIRKSNCGCIFFSYINQTRTTKKYTYVQALFFSLVNTNLSTSTNFNPHQPTSRTSLKKYQLQLTSHYFNQLRPIIHKKKKKINSLQPTSTHFNLLQPTLTYFNKKIPTSTYFNSLLPISTNFTHSPTHISQRKDLTHSIRKTIICNLREELPIFCS